MIRKEILNNLQTLKSLWRSYISQLICLRFPLEAFSRSTKTHQKGTQQSVTNDVSSCGQVSWAVWHVLRSWVSESERSGHKGFNAHFVVKLKEEGVTNQLVFMILKPAVSSPQQITQVVLTFLLRIHTHRPEVREAAAGQDFLPVPRLMMWKGCHLATRQAMAAIRLGPSGRAPRRVVCAHTIRPSIHIHLPPVALLCACACLFVSLKLRGVEKRGRAEPATKLIRQIPVTLETFSQLRPSTHTIQTAPLFVSFVCFLFASFPPFLSVFRPMDIFCVSIWLTEKYLHSA